MVDVTEEDGMVNVYSEVINGEIHWYTTLTVSNVSQEHERIYVSLYRKKQAQRRKL